MGQGKSSVIIKILVIAAIYFILVLLLVQLVRILENWSQIYPWLVLKCYAIKG